MAGLFAHPGDRITIEGREFDLVIAGDEYAQNEPGNYALVPRPVCVACGCNSTDDGWDNFCGRCVTLAMHAVILRELLDEVIQNNPRIAPVVTHDAEQQAKASRAQRQYIDLESSGWDAVYAYDSAGIQDMIGDVASLLHEVIDSRIQSN